MEENTIDSWAETIWDAWHCEESEDLEPDFSDDYLVDKAKYAEMDEIEVDNYCFGWNMEYSLFDDDFWKAFKKFDETSKAFIAQCYREGLKNGKDIKEIRKMRADSDIIEA